MARKIEDI